MFVTANRIVGFSAAWESRQHGVIAWTWKFEFMMDFYTLGCCVGEFLTWSICDAHLSQSEEYHNS